MAASESSHTLARWRLAGLGLYCAGCSSLADGGDSLAPPWRCLDDLPTSAGAAAVAAPARVEISFQDLFQAMPLRGLDVRACLAIDSSCTSPIGPALRSDDAGSVTLELYRGFDGYLEIQGEGVLSSLVFLPIVQQDQSLGTMGLVPEANLRTFNTNFNAGIAFEKGHLVVRVRDCDGLPAAGVVLETDVSSRRFYMIGGLPEFTSPSSGPAGVGGFLNIETAGARVVGSLTLGDGDPFAVGFRTFAIRPGWVTFGDVGAGRLGAQ